MPLFSDTFAVTNAFAYITNPARDLYRRASFDTHY